MSIESKKNQTQLITGYYFQIFERNKKNQKALVNNNEVENGIDLNAILMEFLNTLNSPKRIYEDDRIIHVNEYKVEEHDNKTTRINFKARTGRFGYGSELVDVKTFYTQNVDSNKALIFPYHIYFYNTINNKTHLCIFHRFGHGGSKTAFIKEINRFLKDNYGFILKTKAIINKEYQMNLLKGRPIKLRYISYNRIPKSSDMIENLDGPSVARYEEQITVSINLKSEKMKKRFKLNVEKDEPQITFENLPNEFFMESDKVNTKLDLMINGRTKVWDMDGRTMFDYEISEELNYREDNHPTDESMDKVMIKYAKLFSLGVELDVD